MSYDNWEKTRRTWVHLTSAEIDVLRAGFKSGAPAVELARQLKCSSRVVYKWFAAFRGNTPEPVRRRSVRQPAEPPVKKPLPSRFYHSTFEL